MVKENPESQIRTYSERVIEREKRSYVSNASDRTVRDTSALQVQIQ